MSKELDYIEELKLRYKEENGTVRRLSDIEKSLKALEIIKRELKYNVDFEDASDFRAYIDGMICCENKEEYDLLKEVLLWD